MAVAIIGQQVYKKHCVNRSAGILTHVHNRNDVTDTMVTHPLLVSVQQWQCAMAPTDGPFWFFASGCVSDQAGGPKIVSLMQRSALPPVCSDLVEPYHAAALRCGGATTQE